MSFKPGNTLGRKHGHASNDNASLVYKRWRAMRWRCNPKNKHSRDAYWGRGISVCERWDKSFESFLADMGTPPKGHELDRIDNNKGYSPENCRWASRLDNQHNRSVSINITWNGVTKNLGDWARHVGMNYLTLKHRIEVGWDLDVAFTKRPNRKAQYAS